MFYWRGTWIGIGRDNVTVLNIVKCRPPNNRTPTNTEMNHCGNKWLLPQLRTLNPPMIITLGSVALRYFFPQAKMTLSKGKPLFHNGLQTTIYPMFHPSYILRNGNKLLDEYYDDFKLMLKLHQSKDKGSYINSFDEARFENNDITQKSLDEYF
ncbi:MAG: uracil-DNA glycosylase [Candidatus Kariarchaeaceae archaeon]|jgi:uracil-DNA glycosylase family 4